jgi:hypothetical protein
MKNGKGPFPPTQTLANTALPSSKLLTVTGIVAFPPLVSAPLQPSLPDGSWTLDEPPPQPARIAASASGARSEMRRREIVSDYTGPVDSNSSERSQSHSASLSSSACGLVRLAGFRFS